MIAVDISHQRHAVILFDLGSIIHSAKCLNALLKYRPVEYWFIGIHSFQIFVPLLCYCRIFAYFGKVRISHIFLHKLAFSTAVLILFVILLPISIRFRYLDHLIANRMAPSMCPNPCGTRWRSWFQAILYHISAAYLAFMRSAYFIIFNENAA